MTSPMWKKVAVGVAAALTLLRIFAFSGVATGCSSIELDAAKKKILTLQGMLRPTHRPQPTMPRRPSGASLTQTTAALESDLLLQRQPRSPLSPRLPPPTWPYVSSATVAARRAAGQHPTYRIALVVPWLGSEFPTWFPYFVESCRTSEYLTDVLVFHEAAKLPDTRPPNNVRFIDVGEHGLGAVFGTALARLAGMENSTYMVIHDMILAFHNYRYIVTEYKPAYGAVFEPYLSE